MARVKPKYEHDPLCPSHMGGACDCYVAHLESGPKTTADLRRLRSTNKERNVPKKSPSEIYSRGATASGWLVAAIVVLAFLAIVYLVSTSAAGPIA